jgi:SHS2 domain-containing protein
MIMMRWAVYPAREHEVELRLHGRDLHQLFEEAGHALAEFLAGCAPARADEAYELVQLEARDRDALLCAWLAELIALGERDHKVFTSFQIEHVDDRTLVAGVRGVAWEADASATPLHPGVRCHISGGGGTLDASVVLTP